MVHLFKIMSDNLALDSESGAFHLLDDAAAALLEVYIAKDGRRPSDQELADLRKIHGPDLTEIAGEIDQLIAREELFCPPREVRLEQLYPDEPRIKSMCLHLCHDCNLRCRYCFAGTGDFGTGRRTMLDEATGKKAIDFLIEASGTRKNLDIDFFGGEPLLNWPVVESLVAYCQQRQAESGKVIRLTITTNAVLLDQEKIDFINKHFDNCVLSIDGRPQVHDRMRPDAGGHGSHDRVAANIRSFVQARGQGQYYLRGTFTRHNLDFAEDVLHLASLGDQVSMEPVVAPAGSGYEIRQEDLAQIKEEYERLARIMDQRRKEGRPFNFFHFMIDLSKGPCAFKRIKGCGLATEYCAVTPEGDIYPCHQFVGQEDFIMANVHDDPIQLDQAVIGPFKNLLLPDKPDCQACWAKFFCSGGCAANSYHVSGRVDGSDPIGCELQKKRLECALWLKSRSFAD